ncbi:TPA: ABC transporter ATP-binding protein [Candidatus Galligastranaerophilus intestinigallinarum]|nr:ABC transporter ATP-binding protein [Candidatus Galligastranaerophilus intestinigallinarum]
MENLVEIKNVYKTYFSKQNAFSKKIIETNAVNNVSFNIKKGEIKGLVGESGCGKTTLGNMLLKLTDTTKGEILFKGQDISKFNKTETKNFRKSAQMIFQNPYSSLNPKMKIKDILVEPLDIFKIKKNRDDILYETIFSVGLNEDDLKRFPHEFSGGQRQRIAIARALILRPDFIVADEPVSALDVSIQAQIINLLIDLKEKYNLTYLFISHDLNVVKYLCENVVIMNKGKIEEMGKIEDVFNNPKTDYTKTLINSIPKLEI